MVCTALLEDVPSVAPEFLRNSLPAAATAAAAAWSGRLPFLPSFLPSFLFPFRFLRCAACRSPLSLSLSLLLLLLLLCPLPSPDPTQPKRQLPPSAATGEEEGEESSLSLSLSFPFPSKFRPSSFSWCHHQHQCPPAHLLLCSQKLLEGRKNSNLWIWAVQTLIRGGGVFFVQLCSFKERVSSDRPMRPLAKEVSPGDHHPG